MTGALQWVGLAAASVAAAVALLSSRPRTRALAMLVALALVAVLIASDVWDSARFHDLRHSPARLGAGLVIGAAALAALAALFTRRPLAVPLLAFALLPFRVPVDVGNGSVNLLIPLYLVVGGAAIAAALAAWRGEAVDDAGAADARPRPRLIGVAVEWLPRLLAAFIVIYALQSAYSPVFSQALEDASFFLIPFAVLYSLLSRTRWTRPLLLALLGIAVGEALVFAAVAIVQSQTHDLFWNQQVIDANALHTYFRVNSLFWDPNILGRYLVLAILALTAAMLWVRSARLAVAAALGCGVLIVALTLTYSQSSLLALLAGLVALAALRWDPRWALGAAGIAFALAVLLFFVAGSGLRPGNSGSFNTETSGRSGLVKGGAEIAADRPLWGYGSGSFQHEYLSRFKAPSEGTAGTVSHTEAITVASEQGFPVLVVWIALVAVGLGTALAAGGWTPAVRGALVACLVALVVHSFAYAGLLIDPVTWALLGAGAALARRPAGAAVAAGTRATPPPRSPPPEGQPSLA